MILIRPATGQDARTMAALEAESTGYPWRASQYRDSIAQGHPSLLLEQDGHPTGLAIGMLLPPDEAEILNIAIRPARQGQGLGAQLLQALLDHFRQQGIRRVFLEVRQSNLPARQLYQKLGFVSTGQRKNYYSAPTGHEHAILMECTL
jgi:ribosomal-protein-alanine N-acetyltransferase